jgi:hypothetical protein
MLDELSASEWGEWMGYLATEPMLPERMELGFAQLCALTGNLLGRPKSGGAFDVSDFLPRWETPEERREREARVMAAKAKFEEDCRAFDEALVRLKAKGAPEDG